MKMIIRVTEEQFRALEVARQDGRLKALGITGMRTVPGPRRWPPTPSSRVASLTSSALGLLCSLSAFLPVWRPPFFAAGIALGLTGIGLGYKRRTLLLLAGLAAAANVAGWGLYAVEIRSQRFDSTMIILVPVYSGRTRPEVNYSDGTSVVKIGTTSLTLVASERTARVATEATRGMIGEFGGPTAATLTPGSAEARRFDEFEEIITALHMSGKPNLPGDAVRLSPGRHPLGLTANGKTVYEGNVYIPKSSNIYVILDKNPDDTIRVFQFLPDITKPAPSDP